MILFILLLTSHSLSSSPLMNVENDFSSRLEKTLSEATKKYKKRNEAFLIGIYYQDKYLIQIIHNSDFINILDYDEKFGYSITLYFPHENENESNLQLKFKQLDRFNEFSWFDCDSCDGYRKNVKTNNKEAIDAVEYILENLYGIKNSNELIIKLKSFEEMRKD